MEQVSYHHYYLYIARRVEVAGLKNNSDKQDTNHEAGKGTEPELLSFNVQSEQDKDKMLPVNCIPTDKDISKHFEQTVTA